MPPLTYDSVATYDGPFFYDSDVAVPPPIRKKMIRLVLDLRSKTDAELKQYSLNHISKMAGNAAFPTPVPATVAFQSLHDAFSAALTAADAAQTAAKQATATKDAARVALETGLSQRQSNIEGTPGLTEAQALSTGIAIRAGSAPVGDMPKPLNLNATGGDQSGEVDLQWQPVKGRNTYLAEHATSPAGPWTQFYVEKKSSATAGGLTPGALYYFRVRASAANGPGPWSDPAECRAS